LVWNHCLCTELSWLTNDDLCCHRAPFIGSSDANDSPLVNTSVFRLIGATTFASLPVKFAHSLYVIEPRRYLSLVWLTSHATRTPLASTTLGRSFDSPIVSHLDRPHQTHQAQFSHFYLLFRSILFKFHCDDILILLLLSPPPPAPIVSTSTIRISLTDGECNEVQLVATLQLNMSTRSITSLQWPFYNGVISTDVLVSSQDPHVPSSLNARASSLSPFAIPTECSRHSLLPSCT